MTLQSCRRVSKRRKKSVTRIEETENTRQRDRKKKARMKRREMNGSKWKVKMKRRKTDDIKLQVKMKREKRVGREKRRNGGEVSGDGGKVWRGEEMERRDGKETRGD